MTFLVDTGAQHSVLTSTTAPLSDLTAWVQGATGGKNYHWTSERKVDLAHGTVSHSFLLVPDCPYPLLGRDLLTKLKAHIHFTAEGSQVTGPGGSPLHVLTLALEDEYRLYSPKMDLAQNSYLEDWLEKFPEAWAETGGMGLAERQPPILVPLKT